jgi:hypothetical protein
MNSPKLVVIVAAVALLVVGTAIIFRLPGGAKKIERRTSELAGDISSLADPVTSKMRNFVPMGEEGGPRVRHNDDTAVQIEPRRLPANQSQQFPSLSLVGYDPAPEPVRSPERKKYPEAPAFRCLRCQLVNTVDSGNIATPIIGRVTEDLQRHGTVVIPRGTEVHGQAQVDTMRERIASRGDFTLIIHDPSRPEYDDNQLVVSGIVLDREYDPEFDTYGLVDMSAGLPGQVIETGDKRMIAAFVASFLSGLAQNAGSTTNGVFGNRLYTNSNAIGTSALQNLVVNPAANGTASVLDLYAQEIMTAVQRDGFYIRVPAGTEFYLYVTETLDLAKAKNGETADEERLSRDERAWRLQANRRAIDNYTGNQLRGGVSGATEPPSMLPPPQKVPDPLERFSPGTESPLQSVPLGMNSSPANAGQAAAVLQSKP